MTRTGDGLDGLRNRLRGSLAMRGGKMTHRQWIGEICLLKREIGEQMTRELVRKTKRYVIALKEKEHAPEPR